MTEIKGLFAFPSTKGEKKNVSHGAFEHQYS